MKYSSINSKIFFINFVRSLLINNAVLTSQESFHQNIGQCRERTYNVVDGKLIAIFFCKITHLNNLRGRSSLL
jgi:hypothetical protein